MATKLVQCARVVAYLPSLRTVVIRCQAFSSVSNTPELPEFEEVRDSKTVWPDEFLGPLGPQDKRFPLPGLVGPCVNRRRLVQDQNIHTVPLPSVDVNSVLPPLPFERHMDISEQFLTSIDEIDESGAHQIHSSPTPSDKMEYKAHDCPNLLRKEFKDLFPERNIMDGELTVITLSIKTDNDMTMWSSEVEEERENLIESFVDGAAKICDAFESSGYWADFIDPSSGKPFKGAHTNFTLFETDERYRNLGFEIHDLGCCKVISHPVWATHVYLGSIFTSTPLDHPLIKNLVPNK